MRRISRVDLTLRNWARRKLRATRPLPLLPAERVRRVSSGVYDPVLAQCRKIAGVINSCPDANARVSAASGRTRTLRARMSTREHVEAAQLRAAEALPDDPVEAARAFGEAFRHARALGDYKWAAVQLSGVALAYSLRQRRNAAIRVLKLAVLYAPDWGTPHGLLGTEFEAQAQAQSRLGAFAKARQSFLQAAFHLRRASELAVLGGADPSSDAVTDKERRARACSEHALKLSPP